MASSLPNYYQILELTDQASATEIKQAFRRLARQHHPDLNPNNPQAAQIFRQVRQAYDVLSDPIQRRRYDQSRQNPTAPDPSSGESSRGHPQTPHDFYLQGIDYELARNYAAAVQAYGQAIGLGPTFAPAYLRRCRLFYALGRDRSVLEDCAAALRLDAQQAEVYFYQGLARLRLGYSQSAIEAFSQAIAQDPEYGQAYRQRARARWELQERDAALEDLQQALDCFQVLGDGEAYHQAASELQAWHGGGPPGSGQRPPTPWHWRLLPPLPRSIVSTALGQLPSILLAPSSNLLPLYSKLSPGQASGVGLVWLGLTYALGLLAATLRWSANGQRVLWPITIVVSLTVASFLAGMGLLRLLQGQGKGMARILFVAGAALVPWGSLCLIMAPRTVALMPLQWSLMTIAGCYSVLLLYNGLNQVCNLPESKAAIAVPLLLLLSGGLAYWSFNTLMPPPLELINPADLV